MWWVPGVPAESCPGFGQDEASIVPHLSVSVCVCVCFQQLWRKPFPVWRWRFLLGLGGWRRCRHAVSLQFHHKALLLFCPLTPFVLLGLPGHPPSPHPHLHLPLLSLALQVQLIQRKRKCRPINNSRLHLFIHPFFFLCVSLLISEGVTSVLCNLEPFWIGEVCVRISSLWDFLFSPQCNVNFMCNLCQENQSNLYEIIYDCSAAVLLFSPHIGAKGQHYYCAVPGWIMLTSSWEHLRYAACQHRFLSKGSAGKMWQTDNMCRGTECTVHSLWLSLPVKYWQRKVRLLLLVHTLANNGAMTSRSATPRTLYNLRNIKCWRHLIAVCFCSQQPEDC